MVCMLNVLKTPTALNSNKNIPSQLTYNFNYFLLIATHKWCY